MATQLVREKYIIWQRTTPPAAPRSTMCTISAHAGPTGATFAVPVGISIFFYVPPATAFIGRTQDVIEIACGNPSPDPVHINQIAHVGANCPDYSFSKLQGYHAHDWGAFQLARKVGHAVKLITEADEEYGNVAVLVDNVIRTASARTASASRTW